MRRGERLAALGQMALALAHEIRNPLGAIRGVAQLLGGELGAGPYREHLEVMLGEIDRVNRVMEALLDLGRPMRFVFAPVNLHELLERVCLLAEPAARAQTVQLVRRYDPSLPALWADADRLTQVFQNLVQNGVEAMPGGGRLTLTTRLSLDPVYAKVDVGGGPRPLVEVLVSDEGEGIPEELRDRVFDPSSRPSPAAWVSGSPSPIGWSRSTAAPSASRAHRARGPPSRCTCPSRRPASPRRDRADGDRRAHPGRGRRAGDPLAPGAAPPPGRPRGDRRRGRAGRPGRGAGPGSLRRRLPRHPDAGARRPRGPLPAARQQPRHRGDRHDGAR